jgi:BirA family transcriptional regulator, biotin operon repressor / biotin---[acetyl-CoA-carboxylase] ligase
MPLQPTIQRFDSIDSTNLEAMRQAKAGAEEGLCIIAREQTRGRGRLDRSWHSPKDEGLYFSIVLRPSFEISRWPLISLAAALAVYDALENASHLKVDIKWPNDICIGDRKLAGILAETVETAKGAAVILGIGINLTSRNLPAELNGLATSIESAATGPLNRDVLVDELVKAVGKRYEMASTEEGCEEIIRDWCVHSSYAYGLHVRVTLPDGALTGVTDGLERDGALRVRTPEGAIKIVRAGDVTAVRAAGVVDSDQ